MMIDDLAIAFFLPFSYIPSISSCIAPRTIDYKVPDI